MEKFKMLIVDDEADFLETILKRLKARKIEVTGVESGYKALEFWITMTLTSPSWMSRLPGMDGLKRCGRSRRRNPWWK